MLVLREDVLLRCGVSSEDGILIALSGGADSVALLLEMKRLQSAGKIGPIAAAHLNHGIRGAEADRDAAFCRALCERLAVPHAEGFADVPALASEKGVSLETAARTARYAFLNAEKSARGLRFLATAHHRDDQAETLLLHLLRGCGTDGLAGMRERSGDLIRPFLSVPKSDLLAYLAERGEPYCEDSTNEQTDALRNRIRHGILPALEAIRPNVSEALAKAASLVAADADWLDGVAERAFQSDPTREELAAMDAPIRMRVLKRYLPYATYERSDLETLDSLLTAQTGTRRDLKFGFTAWTSAKRLLVGRIGSEPYAEELPIGGSVRVPGGTVSSQIVPEALFPCDSETVYLNADAVRGTLSVRSPREGDRFRPFGLGGSKLLSDFFTDRKVPRFFRGGPVLADENGILAVLGYTIDERARVCAGTEHILKINFEEDQAYVGERLYGAGNREGSRF